jgi:eukaryotic-like serine/threonine-protein kinase
MGTASVTDSAPQIPRTSLDATDGTALLEEIRDRWAKGDRIRAESVLERPAFAGCNESAFIDVIYAEQTVRRELGETLVLDEYLERFPAHTSALRRQWLFDEVVEQSSLDPASRQTEISPGSSPRDEPPFVCPGAFGRYVLVAPLDSGGQAFVYRALHPDLGLEVVLKISRDPVSAKTPRGERMLAEARTHAVLSHPNLPQVFDAGIESGYAFLVLEYLRGRTLADVVRYSPLSTSDAVLLAARVAQAVAAAHVHGVLHLDIKPKNIVIDDKGEPRLIDFGLARSQDPWSEDRSGASTLSGTLQFMAPEQARGEKERIGEPSDVFGLGAILLFALTGKPPRTGFSFSELLEKAQNDDWDRSALARMTVPACVVQLCERALCADPAKRISTASAFAQQAEGVLRAIRRRHWWFAPAGGIALFAAAVAVHSIRVLWQGHGDLGPSAIPPRQQQTTYLAEKNVLRVEVWDVDRYLNLPDVAPLKTGDRIRVRMQIPPSTHAALFFASTDGLIRQLAVVPATPNAREVLYPASEQQAVPIIGNPGTEFLFLCGDRNAPVSIDIVKKAWLNERNWPALPELSVVSMNPESVTVEQTGRDLGEAVDLPDAESEVVRLLDQFRGRLRMHYHVIEGWAFAHRKS